MSARVMSAVVTDAAQVTPEWLTDRLKQAGALENGRVAQVEKKPRGGAITALEMTYSEDAVGAKPARLIFKRSRLEEGRFYSDLAPEMARVAGVLRCYDVAYSAETKQSHQLLEDISVTHFDAPEMLPMTLPYAQQIADTLADVHAHWWEHPRLKSDVGAIAEDSPGQWLSRARTQYPHFADVLGDRLSPQRRAIYERLLAALPFPAWRERRAAGKQVTLVHGDAHWWNFMYPRDITQNTIVLIDWEAWHINIGISDLAYTIALECFPEHRARIEQPLARRYHERLLAGGVNGYDWAQCWQDYRMAVVNHLLWPVLWHKDLSPNIWWPALECTMLAFEDLGCEEFLP